MTYEYKLLSLLCTPGDKIKQINQLGEQGWKLVCIEKGIAYFIREKVSDNA